MWLCADCRLAQLADDADVPEEPVGQEPAALSAQRQAAVDALVAAAALPANGTVAEFPSPHGGTWLDLLAEHGLTPAVPGTAADVVVDGCFGIMHAADQLAAFRERAEALRPGGTLVLQFHSLEAILTGAQWNALRLGHYAYYSTPAILDMLGRVGLRVTTAHRFPLYGGTVLLTASRDGAADPSVEALCAAELAAGVLRPEVVAGLQESVRRTATGLREMLERERALGRRVHGYSAASRAVALLCLAGVDATLLHGVADASPAKQGGRMPGTDIPIISPADLVAAEPDAVLLFVPDLLDEVRAALPQVEATGGRWIAAGDDR
jgi:SAM-dependent methyltransferase